MEKGAFEFSARTAVVVILSLVILASAIVLVSSLKVELPKFESGMPQFFEVSVSPEEGQIGTTFRIDVDFADKSLVYQARAEVSREGIDSPAGVILFDDGQHGDKLKDDGVYSGIFESKGLSEGVYSVDVIVNPSESEIKYPDVARFTVYKDNCIPLAYNGHPDEKIDVVILPDQYTDFDEFKRDALKVAGSPPQSKGILTYEPLKSYASRFNFYIVNQSFDLECKQGCQGVSSLVCCNNNKVAAAASQCPADQIIVLRDSSDFCGSASSYAKICNAWNPGQVATHEFGHIFGGLGDEYSYAQTYPGYEAAASVYPNCDIKNCPKWISFWGGCFSGCGVSQFYRPTEKQCIMYTYVDRFDDVDSRHLVSLLDEYKGGATQEVAAPPLEDTYVLDLNYKDGKLAAENVYVTLSKSPDRKALRSVDYVGKLISFEGRTLSEFKFEFPRVEWPAMPRENESDLSHSPIILNETNYTLLAPYLENAERLEVYDLKNQRVLSVDLGYLARTCGDNLCQEHESALTCPSDCRASVSDDLCTYEEDGVCDADCPRVDPDCGLSRQNLYLIAGIIVLALVALIATLFKKKK